MRWILDLADGPRRGAVIDASQVSPHDEYLCGSCGALLAIDHQLWRNAGLFEQGVRCQVCGAGNDPTRGHAVVERREEPPYAGG